MWIKNIDLQDGSKAEFDSDEVAWLKQDSLGTRIGLRGTNTHLYATMDFDDVSRMLRKARDDDDD